MNSSSPLVQSRWHRPNRPRALSPRLGRLLAVLTLAAVLAGFGFAPAASAATGDFVITGRGKGHGTGLSQWGAWQGARLGQTYDQILAFYYPGSSLVSPSTIINASLGANPQIRVRLSTSGYDSQYRVYLRPKGVHGTLVMNASGTVTHRTIDEHTVLEVKCINGWVYVGILGGATITGACSWVELQPASSSGLLEVTMARTSTSGGTYKGQYRGTVQVKPASADTMYADNWVFLDDYGRGIAEIMPEWAKSSDSANYAVEAVKAQAVAAKTYALAVHLSNNPVHDDTRDVCYKGYDYELTNPGAALAAEATNGQVVGYAGGLYKTFFSAHNGGYMTNSAWNDTVYPPNPGVVAKADPWSLAAPTSKAGWPWTYAISPSSLAAGLSGYIDNVGTITQVEVIERDTSDAGSHAKYLRITGTGGTDTISARGFKAALGLTSTLILSITGGSSGVSCYQQTDSRLAYAGSWYNATASSASGGSYRYANSFGSTLTVKFNGTGLALISKKSPAYGQAKVTLDGGTPVSVDLYSASTAYKQNVYGTGTLAAGDHTLVIEWGGAKNASSSGYLITMDAFYVAGTLLQAPAASSGGGVTDYQQTDSRLGYAGSWYNAAASSASRGSYRYANSPGSSVTVTFAGTGLALIAKKSPAYGQAKLTLDGGEPVYVDLYSPSVLYKQNVYGTGTLENKAHTLVIEWAGAKNPSSSGYLITLDAIYVAGTLN